MSKAYIVKVVVRRLNSPFSETILLFAL